MSITTQPPLRVAIIHSGTTAAVQPDPFHHPMAVAYAQAHCVMAGLPFALLSEDMACDAERLTEFGAVVAPAWSHSRTGTANAFSRAVHKVRSHRPLGIVAIGDLLAELTAGDARTFSTMQPIRALFGFRRIHTLRGGSIDVHRVVHTHAVLPPVAGDGPILRLERVEAPVYTTVSRDENTTLLAYRLGSLEFPAVIAGSRGGRNVFFSDHQLCTRLGNLWRAIRWAVLGDRPPATLVNTREVFLFATRFDMDQSADASDLERVEKASVDLLVQWRQEREFVASCYINTVDPVEGTEVDWQVTGPLWRRLGDLDYEIGSHSRSHPYDTAALDDAAIDSEFMDSAREISDRIARPVTGVAIPGNPEPLSLIDRLDRDFRHVSGRVASLGTAFPGGYGWLHPDHRIVYFFPGLVPDFTLVHWEGRSSDQAAQSWLDDTAEFLDKGCAPLVHCLWHDYGPVEGEARYERGMYQRLLDFAASRGAEFVNLSDAERRFRAIAGATFETSIRDGFTRVRVSGRDLGRCALRLGDGYGESSVGEWYAFDRERILLAESGASFTLDTTHDRAPVTRITRLAPRTTLLDVHGDGRRVEFTIEGGGEVVVWLAADGPAAVEAPSAKVRREGRTVRLLFPRPGTHEASVGPA